MDPYNLPDPDNISNVDYDNLFTNISKETGYPIHDFVFDDEGNLSAIYFKSDKQLEGDDEVFNYRTPVKEGIEAFKDVLGIFGGMDLSEEAEENRKNELDSNPIFVESLKAIEDEVWFDVDNVLHRFVYEKPLDVCHGLLSEEFEIKKFYKGYATYFEGKALAEEVSWTESIDRDRTKYIFHYEVYDDRVEDIEDETEILNWSDLQYKGGKK